MNQKTLEKIAEAQKSNTAAVAALVRATFDSMEKLAALNIATSRRLLSYTAENAQAVMQAKDAQGLAKINPAITQPSIEEMVNYSRNLYQLFAQTQQEISALVGARYADLTKKTGENITGSILQSPVKEDVFAATMKSLLNATNMALGHLQSSGKAKSHVEEVSSHAQSSTNTPPKRNTGNGINKRR